VAIHHQIQAQQAELGRIGAEIQTHETAQTQIVAGQQRDEKALAEQRFRRRTAEDHRTQLQRQQATHSADEALATAQREELARQLEIKRQELAAAESAVAELEQKLRDNQEQLDTANHERDTRV